MKKIFAPHGEFKLHISNNILIARLTGSWNQECAENFSEEFTTKIHSMNNLKWGHLVFLDNFELSVPEVLPIISDLVIFCINNGLERAAQVYSQSRIKKMHIDTMVVEKHGNFERRIFTDQDEAIQWLNSNDFTLAQGIVANKVV
jgi:hypothetical protein